MASASETVINLHDENKTSNCGKSGAAKWNVIWINVVFFGKDLNSRFVLKFKIDDFCMCLRDEFSSENLVNCKLSNIFL